jgi:predicted SAM-dependent methyltransferase
MIGIRTWLSKMKRVALSVDRAIKTEYLASHEVKKLQIGASGRLLDGWLNTDLDGWPGVMQMDATKPFPFADGTFDFVFAEHMIEHVPYEGAMFMLAECRRVLRQGGKLRIVAPDLEKLARLYANANDQGYVAWFCKTFVPQDRPQTVGSVLNAHFSMWGHQFLYDETLLADAMAKAGFTAITRQEVGESAYDELRGIENVGRYPDGLLGFESIAIEAVR